MTELLARDIPVQAQRGGAQPAPSPDLPDPTAAAASPFQPHNPRLVDNPLIAPVVYPYRQAMLRRFVAWHREIELGQLPADERPAAIEAVLAKVRAERDRLAALETPSREDQRQKRDLEAMLTRAERNASNALSVAQTWLRGHGGDELAGASLEQEVRRLGTALHLPDWEMAAIIDYGGMRYGRSREESGGAPTAHGSYFAPQRLLWAIQTVRTGQTVSADDASAFMRLSEADALGRLQEMRNAGLIPDRYWRLIAYRTDLRNDTTDTQWNAVNTPATSATTEKERQAAADWGRIMNLWTQDTAIRGARGGASNVVGATGWRNEMYRRRGVVALGVVCNELSEAIANQRGMNLQGGITANAREFATDDSTHGMGTAAGGRYFGPVDPAHLVPGANLFWLKPTWSREGHSWDNVIAAPGVTYPQRLDPGQTGTPPTTALPSGTVGGWTYHAEPGSAVKRDQVVPGGTATQPAAGPPVSQWMSWMHEATVAEVHGTRIWTLETTGGPEMSGAGAGINERPLDRLQQPGVYLGVDATAHPAAPAQPAAPAPHQRRRSRRGRRSPAGMRWEPR